MKTSEIPLFLKWLKNELQHPVGESPLLIQALTHTSYAHEQGKEGQDNERLEFLGDAVLDLVLSDLLFSKFPTANEGQLSLVRSYLVNQSALAEKAREMKLANWLKLGVGESQTGGLERDSNLSSTLEALIGAVYLVCGYEVSYAWLQRMFQNDLIKPSLFIEARNKDSKSVLQEMTQAMNHQVPEYRLVKETGPAHARQFEISVSLESKELGRGMGTTRKVAEQKAALNAIQSGAFQELGVMQ